MGRLQKAGTAVVFVLFFAALALRPLLSNPGVSAALEDGVAWPTVLWLPVVAVSLLVVGARLLLLFDDESCQQADAVSEDQDDHWGVVDGWDNERDHAGPGPDAGGDEAVQIPASTAALTTETKRRSRPSRQRPSYRILGGKGGARDRSFEVEQEPPDASLGAHLDHLRAELADGEDLEELERVVAESETENPIPARCPDTHCNARWEERSVFGINTGRYELLEDDRICCLECETVFDLDSAGESDRQD